MVTSAVTGVPCAVPTLKKIEAKLYASVPAFKIVAVYVLPLVFGAIEEIVTVWFDPIVIPVPPAPVKRPIVAVVITEEALKTFPPLHLQIVAPGGNVIGRTLSVLAELKFTLLNVYRN